MEDHKVLRNSKLLHIHSKDRRSKETAPSHDFVINFNDYQLQDIMHVIVKEIYMPFTVYNITRQKNHSFYIEYNAVFYSVALPNDGFYTLAQLEAELIAQCALVGITLNSISLNPTTKKLDFDFALPSRIFPESSYPDGNIGNALGVYDLLGAPALTFSGDSVPDLTATKKIYVGSNTLAGQSHTFISKDRNLHIFASMDVTTTNFGDILYLRNDDIYTADEGTYTFPRNITTLDITLYDEDLNKLDLNGAEWSMVLKVFT